MIQAVLIAVSTGLLAYLVLVMLEERVMARRRVALVTASRVQQSTASLDKGKIIAKLTREQKGGKSGKPHLPALLLKAGINHSARRVRVVAGAAGLLVGLLSLLLLNSLVLAAIAGLLVALVLPRLTLAYLIARREAAFLDELPNALEMISRGLRAGMTLASCLKQISESTAEPLRSEFAYVLDLQKLGMPLGEAIRKMPERTDLLDLRFFTIVIEIQQKSGGNLAEVLENISTVIRGRKEMRAKVKALVSEAKVSSIIIGILPLGFGAVSWFTDPDAFSKFWTDPIGMVLLGLSGFLYTTGTVIFVKLASPKV